MSGYVIFSPCRTGSTIIYNNLWNDNNSTVIHTHDHSWRPPSNNFVCILSKRQDQFAEVISHAVMDITGEVHIYSNATAPFAVDLNRFYNLYHAHKSFYNKIHLDGYTKVVDIWYDQLISDPYYLYRELGQNQKTDYTTIPKSPYDYRQLITNYTELEQVAKKVEQETSH